MKIYSLDAETNGLWGQAFSIGVVIYDTNTKNNENWVARCPISEPINSWVAENILPQMESIPVTHDSYESMLQDFISHYMANKENSVVLVHMGLPVEARLFLDAHELGYLGDWDAPYPLVDCSAIPTINTSVDTYNTQHGIEVPSFDGGTHNPLYDAYAAAVAYAHATKEGV